MSQVLARFSLQQATRCPFLIDGKTQEATSIVLNAVQGEPFGPATPQGVINAIILNSAAAKVFNEAAIGQEFDVLFTPVSAPAQAPESGEQAQA